VTVEVWSGAVDFTCHEPSRVAGYRVFWWELAPKEVVQAWRPSTLRSWMETTSGVSAAACDENSVVVATGIGWPSQTLVAKAEVVRLIRSGSA
jgi:hypothetical protein